MVWYSVFHRGPADFVVQTNRGRHVYTCTTEAEADAWIAQRAVPRRQLGTPERVPSKIELARTIQRMIHGTMGPQQEANAQAAAKRSTAASLQAAIARLAAPPSPR